MNLRLPPLVTLSALLLLPALRSAAQSDETGQVTLHANADGPTINRNIYGQFAEHLGHGIYGGIWVEENSSIPNTHGFRTDVLTALKNLHIPVLRWPGGCFADTYHWKDGIGPREKRPSIINSTWGGVVENNHFGTHEFLDLCEQIGAEPYITGNLGSGSVQEMAEWVEYLTSDADSPMANLRRANGREKPWKVSYFAVGNESWGCGGNMRPEYYADVYRRYNTFLKDYSGNKLYRIACGPSEDDYRWSDTVMKNTAGQLDGLSLHYYTLPTGQWKTKGSATAFSEDLYFATLRNAFKMDKLITEHSKVMDQYDSKKKVGLVVDEWGVWTDPEPGTNPAFLYQQNSMRDALVAAVHFHIFQAHADRVVMANIAQMVNVLQSMILTNDKSIVLTPTYHVFEMFTVHQDAKLIPLDVKSPEYKLAGESLPAVTGSASRDKSGKVHLSLINLDPHHEITVQCAIEGAQPASTVTGRILAATAMTDHNTFEAPHTLEPKDFTGATVSAGQLSVKLPALSVVVLTL